MLSARLVTSITTLSLVLVALASVAETAPAHATSGAVGARATSMEASNSPREDLSFSAILTRFDGDFADYAVTGPAGWVVTSSLGTPLGDDRIGTDGRQTVRFSVEKGVVYNGFLGVSDPDDPDPSHSMSRSIFLDADLRSPSAPQGGAVTPGPTPRHATLSFTARMAGLVQVYDAGGALRGSAVVPATGVNGETGATASVDVVVSTGGDETLNARFRYGAFLSVGTPVDIGAIPGDPGTSRPSVSATVANGLASITVSGQPGATAAVSDALGKVVAQVALENGRGVAVVRAPQGRAHYRVTQTTTAGTSAPADVVVNATENPLVLDEPQVALSYDQARHEYSFRVTAAPGAVVAVTAANSDTPSVLRVAGVSGVVEFRLANAERGLYAFTQRVGAVVSPAALTYLS